MIPHAPIVLPPSDAIQILGLNFTSYFSTPPFLPFAGPIFCGKRIRTSPESLDFTGVSRLVLIIRYGHTYATYLVRGGAELRAVQTILGHQSIGVTELYTHINVDDQRRAASKLAYSGAKSMTQK